MTQQEYDARMTELNNQMQAELAPIHKQMDENNLQKLQIRHQQTQLQIQLCELGSQFYSLCSQAKAIKDKYQALKHEVYLERPEKL